MFAGAHVEPVADDRGRGPDRLAEREAAEHFVRPPGAHDRDVAVGVDHQDAAAAADHGGGVAAADRQAAAFVDHLAGARVEAGDHAAVIGQVEQSLVEEVRGHVAGALAVGPDPRVAIGQIAAAVEGNGEDDLARVARSEHGQIADRHRGVDRVVLESRGAPEFAAVGGVVGDHQLVAAGDQLLLAVVLNHDRRRPARLHRPLALPDFLAGCGVERDDEGVVATVLVGLDDEQTAGEHR